MRAVNLLPRQQVAQKRERSNSVPLIGAIGGAVVLLALVGGFLLANRSVARQRTSLADAKALLAATPAKEMSAKTKEFRTKLLSQRQERSLALAAGISKRVAWDRILRRVTLILPSDVWLTKVTGTVPLVASPSLGAPTTTGPSALPATPTALTITGDTYSQASVARLLERLQVIPDLKNVQLQTSVPDSTLPGVVDFTILADVRKGRGAS